jgi:hypothetical protein
LARNITKNVSGTINPDVFLLNKKSLKDITHRLRMPYPETILGSLGNTSRKETGRRQPQLIQANALTVSAQNARQIAGI